MLFLQSYISCGVPVGFSVFLKHVPKQACTNLCQPELDAAASLKGKDTLKHESFEQQVSTSTDVVSSFKIHDPTSALSWVSQW
jgi:hypothetical protein